MPDPHTNSSVSGSELNGGSPKAVVDLDSTKGWYDINERPTWLKSDFLTREIHVDCCTITFGTDTEFSTQKWTLEVIDDHSSDQTRRRECDVVKFECNRPSERAFRSRRLSPTKSFRRYYQLGLSCLEFFGTLRENN
jgi:hypothetical protein